MEIFLNGERHLLAEGQTVEALVQSLQLAGKRFAVEVNEQIVPRSALGTTCLQAGDRVEIVQAIGGG